MPLYNVHIYREMRLEFNEIEAETAETAAERARQLSLKVADEVDDCDGETFYACVDVVGDDDYEQSRWIDFEEERLRQAAPKLLHALVELLRQIDEDIPTDSTTKDFASAYDDAQNVVLGLVVRRPS